VRAGRRRPQGTRTYAVATKGGLHAEPDTWRTMGTPRWAVLVGVSKYRDSRLHLRYAHRDVEELWKVLQTNACGRFADDHARLLVDGEATTAAITHAIRSFLQQAQGDDLVLVYFSGHSAPDPRRPRNLYFLTHDTDLDDIAATALPMREIRHSLDENLDARRVILLMDTCHAAAAGSKGATEKTDAAALVRYLDELRRAKDGFAFFASSEAGEHSREHERWGGGHGLFTHLVLEGLRGKADLDKNGLVTLGELFDYVTQQTPLEGGPTAQHPRVGLRKFDRKLVVAVTGGADARTRFALGQQLYRMAIELGDRRRFAAAARYLTEADDLASVERGLPEARMLAGLAHLGAGDIDRACAALQDALTVSERRRAVGEPGVPDAGYFLAAALAIRGSTEAAPTFDAFVRDHPASPRAPVARVMARLLRGAATRRSHALLVGVGTFRHRVADPLRGPANDVALMRDALLSSGGAMAEADVRCLVDEQATAAAVRRALGALQSESPDEPVVIYFSGRSLGTDHECLALHDTAAGRRGSFESGLGVRELHELVIALRARHVVLVLDTLASQELLDLARAAGGRYCLLVAASPGERAFEVVFDRKGTMVLAGIMTFGLTQALAELGPSAAWRDLVAALQRPIESRGFAQTPSFVGDGDRPFLARPPSAEPAELLRTSLFGAARGKSAAELEAWRRQVAGLVEVPFPDFHLGVAREVARQGALDAAADALAGAVTGGEPTEASWWRAWIAARRGQHAEVLAHVRSFVDERPEAERERWTAEVQTAIDALGRRPRAALVVGIDAYTGPELRRLTGAVKDATAVARALVRVGFDRERVTVLRDEEATAARIVDELRRLTGDAASGPLLFYFAGLGSTGKAGPTLLGVDARKDGVFDIALDPLWRAHPNLTCIVDADTDGKGEARDRWAPVDVRAQADAPRLATGANGAQRAVHVASRGNFRLTAALLQSLRRKARPATWSSWAAAVGPGVVVEGGDDRLFHDVTGSAAIEEALRRARVAPFAAAASVMEEMLAEGRIGARDGWVDIAVARAMCGERAAAAAALNRAIAAAPDDPHAEAHYHLGRVLFENGTDLSRAQVELGLAVKADPDDPAIKYYLGAAIRGFLEGESVHISRRAQQMWQDYLDAGAPLGHRAEVEAYLGSRR
jgi:tetratricopeptide (TPR) repeat protein